MAAVTPPGRLGLVQALVQKVRASPALLLAVAGPLAVCRAIVLKVSIRLVQAAGER